MGRVRSRLPRLGATLVLLSAALGIHDLLVRWSLVALGVFLLVPLARAGAFVRAFVPYGALWLGFTALRSLADETPLAGGALPARVPVFERALFGRLPTTALQDRLFDPARLHWYDYGCTFVHWSFFLAPHAVALGLWLRSPARFRRYRRAMTLVLGLGLLIYFLLPTDPPWMAPERVDSPASPSVHRVMVAVGTRIGGGLYRASYQAVGESNPIAAMPSIHFAVTALLVFAAWDAGRWWRRLALVYASLMAFSLVYLGEHYVVDEAVGVLVTGYGWGVTGAWRGWGEGARLSIPGWRWRLSNRGDPAPETADAGT